MAYQSHERIALCVQRQPMVHVVVAVLKLQTRPSLRLVVICLRLVFG